MPRLSTKNCNYRATAKPASFMLKVFCAILKTAPFSDDSSTLRHKDQTQSLSHLELLSIVQPRIKSVDKIIIFEFCQGPGQLIGCINYLGIVNIIIWSSEDPSNATQICCILLHSIPAVWSIMDYSVETKSPAVPNVLDRAVNRKWRKFQSGAKYF